MRSEAHFQHWQLLCVLIKKGKFSVQPQPNPFTQCHVSSLGENAVNEANSVTTLRNGKVVDKTIHPKEKVSNPPLEMKNRNSLDNEGKFKEGKCENHEKKNIYLQHPFLKDCKQLRN